MSNQTKKKQTKVNHEDAIKAKWNMVLALDAEARNALQQILGMGEVLGYNADKLNKILNTKVFADPNKEE